MIFKQAKRKTYTIVDNAALRDTTLSFKATGLLAYLLSMPDDWKPNSRHLATIKTDGRASVMAGLRELEACGYLNRRKIVHANGVFDWLIEVFEHPQPMVQKPTHGLEIDTPWVGFPSAGYPSTENRPTKESLRLLTNEKTSTNGRTCQIGGEWFTLDPHGSWVADEPEMDASPLLGAVMESAQP